MFVPPGLIEAIENGLSVAWCGAGLSVPKGLPMWSDLVRLLIDTARQNGLHSTPRQELEDLYKYSYWDEIVEYCRGFLGESLYRDFLANALACDDGLLDTHNLLLSLPFRCVLTTNYDKAIEKAYVSRFQRLPTVYTNLDTVSLWKAFARQAFFILKVHGDIERPDTVVLSSRDYTQHIFGNIPFMQFMQRLLMSMTVVFMGTSLNDAYVKRLLEETQFMCGGLGLSHFAIFPHHVGEIRARFLRDRYNVVAIEGTAEDFLAELAARSIAR